MIQGVPVICNQETGNGEGDELIPNNTPPSIAGMYKLRLKLMELKMILAVQHRGLLGQKENENLAAWWESLFLFLTLTTDFEISSLESPKKPTTK